MSLPHFALPLLLAFASPAIAQDAPPKAAPKAVPEKQEAFDLDLEEEADDSIRWLRAQQQPDGSYGGSVVTTAWVLQAYAETPRHYARRDGPFVRSALEYLAAHQDPASGLIHDADAEKTAVLEQSVLALLALRMYDDAQSKAVREKLEATIQEMPADVKPKALSRDEAIALVKRRLASRLPDRTWDGPDGKLIETSRAVIDVARAWEVLEPEPDANAPTSKLPKFAEADRRATIDSMQKGALFLVATSQNGRWGAEGHPDAGLTAMVLGGLEALPAPRPESIQKTIDQGLAWLVSLQDEAGAIHDGKLKNYTTSAAILALAAAHDERYAPAIAKARKFLEALQSDEGEGYSEGDLFYGGIGYGDDERPDLSNLHMALEALAASGSEKGDETFKKALKFLERTQNRSESNDLHVETDGTVIVSGNDGGGTYYPGGSKAGLEDLPDGTKAPRSYGSMTYALLQGFVFAGLPKDDPRMQAAWNWIRQHYTLDVNPGFEQARDPRAPYWGLFYYFHTMAKALDLYGEETVVDANGAAHPWRKQLCGRLVAMQRKDDGSWLNENSPRWWEGNPQLATAYALITLGAALPKEEGR